MTPQVPDNVSDERLRDLPVSIRDNYTPPPVSELTLYAQFNSLTVDNFTKIAGDNYFRHYTDEPSSPIRDNPNTSAA